MNKPDPRTLAHASDIPKHYYAFNKNIMLLRHGGKQGKSIIYHSPLDSSSLRMELENFNKLLSRFFNGEFYEILLEHSDKKEGWEFHNEIVVDNAKLRKTK